MKSERFGCIPYKLFMILMEFMYLLNILKIERSLDRKEIEIGVDLFAKVSLNSYLILKISILKTLFHVPRPF